MRSHAARPRASVLVLAALLLALLQPSPRGPAPAASPGGPVRGAYFYYYQPETHLDDLAAHGFDTGLVKYFQSSAGPEVAASIARKRARADSLGMRLYPTLNFHNPRLLETRTRPERRFRDRRGVVHPGIPCPADTAYWCALVEEMLLPAANATPAPARLALDLELYGVPMAHYPPGPCTCTPCRLDYAGYTSAANRELAAAWIDRLPLGDFEDLERTQIGWVADLLVATLPSLAAGKGTDPLAGHLDLAVLDLGRPGLPNRALLQALERLDLPVLDFTEVTYGRGSAVPEAELEAPYAGRGLRVGIVGGLWLREWPPERLEEEAVRLGERGAGYWIFTSLSLALPPSELEGHYTLPAPAADTWRALERANRRLAPGD